MKFFKKMYSILKLAKNLKSPLFKRICSPKQTAEISCLVKNIKDSLSNDDSIGRSIGVVLDLLVAFRKENPNDYKEIVTIINEILDEYEKNPDEIKQNLADILE